MSLWTSDLTVVKVVALTELLFFDVLIPMGKWSVPIGLSIEW